MTFGVNLIPKNSNNTQQTLGNSENKWNIYANNLTTTTINNKTPVSGVKGNSESSYRTGDVNITAANIGLGNVENKSSATIRGELTKANVTTALGYTPPTADSKVTSAANHYTPSRDTNADKSASASGATAAWNIDVVKGVTVQTDGKGHVTGVNVTSGKIPANPNTDTHRPIQVNGTQVLASNTTALNLKAGSNVTITDGGSGAITIAATDTNTWRGIQDNLTSSSNTTESLSAKQGYLLANGSARDNTKVEKTTYEYNREISFGSSGLLLIGKFPCYDSNVTIEIKSTTNQTYYAVAILATQNINTTGEGTISWCTYGDTTNSVTANLYAKYVSGSNNIEIYFVPTSWSKNLIHIQAVALRSAPTNICESVTSKPAEATRQPTNTAINASYLISGTLSADRLATSGATAGSYGDSSAQTPGYGSTFKVPYVTVDNKGRVTSINDHTVKIPASDNTWRPVSDSVSSTSSSDAASSKAVKTAYDLAASKTANTGTVTSVATGVGLTGGTITGSGTLKTKLRSETALTIDSAAATTTSGRVYPVAVDKTGYLAVNVPWTDNNTTYSAGTGLSLSGTTFSNSGATGVKGNAESSYRTGDVNLTPANIGAAPYYYIRNSADTRRLQVDANGVNLWTIGDSSSAKLIIRLDGTIPPANIGLSATVYLENCSSIAEIHQALIDGNSLEGRAQVGRNTTNNFKTLVGDPNTGSTSAIAFVTIEAQTDDYAVMHCIVSGNNGIKHKYIFSNYSSPSNNKQTEWTTLQLASLSATISTTYCDTSTSEIKVTRAGNIVTVTFNLKMKAKGESTNILATGLPHPLGRIIFAGGYVGESRRLSIDTNGNLTCYYNDIASGNDLFGCVSYATNA